MPAIQHNTADIIWKSPGSDMEVLDFHYESELSELFTLNVRLKSKNKGLAFGDMLKKDSEMVVKCGENLESERKFCGIVTRFGQARTSFGDVDTTSNKSYYYDVEIRPKMWLLTKKKRMKFYKAMSVKDIVSQVLDAASVEFDWMASNGTESREYTAQYNETDFDFISRLIEDEGVHYHFSDGGKKVVFGSSNGDFTQCAPISSIHYCEDTNPHLPYGRNEIINDFTYEQVVSSGKHINRQFKYLKFDKKKEDSESGKLPAFDDLDVFEYSDNHEKHGKTKPIAKLRQEAATASGHHGHGHTSCRCLDAGHYFTMTDHYRDDMNKAWVVSHCLITGEQGRVRTEFDSLPRDVVFRPERTTTRPRVMGVHTGTIVGDGEISIDEEGRCQVAFHWDGERTSTLWIRVSNGYAGNDYGIQWVPRVGHEVLVSFVNGDPDHPVVTGRVYNSSNKKNLGPDKKFQNIIKTIKDNHIIFDDTDGKEMFDFRAQKDMKTLVENDKTTTVNNDNKILVVGKQEFEVQKTRDHKVIKDETITVEENQKTTVTKKITIESKTDKILIKTPKEIKLQCGSSSITMKPTKIVLDCAGSTIEMLPGSITEKAPIIKLNP